MKRLDSIRRDAIRPGGSTLCSGTSHDAAAICYLAVHNRAPRHVTTGYFTTQRLRFSRPHIAALSHLSGCDNAARQDRSEPSGLTEQHGFEWDIAAKQVLIASGIIGRQNSTLSYATRYCGSPASSGTGLSGAPGRDRTLLDRTWRQINRKAK